MGLYTQAHAYIKYS